MNQVNFHFYIRQDCYSYQLLARLPSPSNDSRQLTLCVIIALRNYAFVFSRIKRN